MPPLLILLLLLLLPSCLLLHYLYGKVDPPLQLTHISPSLSKFSSVVMAKEWEMMDFTMGVGMASAPPAAPFTAAAAASPAATYLYGSIPPIVDELLDLSPQQHEDCFPSMEGVAPGGATPYFSEFKPLQGPKSSSSSFDLYIPQCEEAAELEWLSKFVDDSFSDVPYCNSGLGAVIAPATKREATTPSRADHSTSVSAVWSSLVAPVTMQNASPPSPSSSSSSEFAEKAGGAESAGKGGKGKKGGGGVNVRRCTHCASEKTPQWRTGPLGPKTLCNACGVRFKSGRLVPEYRPAASPTFVLTQHSNSHRKVMELRRQKEMLVVGGLRQEGDAASAAAISELLLGDYGVC
ncbi:GATA transcription factor 4-like [Zingiber officinale]|uniref:GATA transcription factor 4-like n=1 Tax=Zingiber officinale TaxID=94328 RepID=UPI001C4D7952|nr:GATA transcription factor 4-like [Zingiber officinale]XP_042393671.1 GATA transcription factor 4-like [Zingiber officinale]